MKNKKLDVLRNNIDNARRWHDCYCNYVEDCLARETESGIDGMILVSIDQMVQNILYRCETLVDELERMASHEE